MVVVYDHTVQEHHFFSSGTLMASTCDLLGTKMGETAQCGILASKQVWILALRPWPRSGLIFLSPDLGLAPLARSALVARGHVDPYWRGKKIENKSGSWPVPLGQDPDLKK